MNGSEAVEYATLSRRLLAALIDNLTWLIALFWLLAYVPESTIEDHPEAFGIAFFVLAVALVQLLRVLRVALGADDRQECVGIEVSRRSIDRPG